MSQPNTGTQLMDAEQVSRSLTRIAHEIVENNRKDDSIVIVGIQRGGVPIANKLVEILARIGHPVESGYLDITMHRDDAVIRPLALSSDTSLPDISNKVVVLVDNVLYTGRTVKAAMTSVIDHGRFKALQLAVLVDRGHRELPIRADFVGKSLPTNKTERIEATLEGVVLTKVDSSSEAGVSL